MTLAQTLIENARAELDLAILSGNVERELELRRQIAEMQAPVEPLEVYSPHTVVINEPTEVME